MMGQRIYTRGQATEPTMGMPNAAPEFRPTSPPDPCWGDTAAARSECGQEAGIEWVHPERLAGRRRCVLFDFDGTLSLVRGHWQGIMVPMMVQTLAAVAPGAPREELTEVVEQFVTELTGQPTMQQILALAEEVRRRGGQPPDPARYLAEYLAELARRTEQRLAALAAGQMHADELLVPGARALLETLARRGWLLALASGTADEDVRREAAALGIDHFFGPRIWAPVHNDPDFSKQQVLQRLLDSEGLLPQEVAVVGDGPAEIRAGCALGALTVGVASDERYRDGRVHPRKRRHLIEAGADVILPDFRPLPAVVALLEGRPLSSESPTDADGTRP